MCGKKTLGIYKAWIKGCDPSRTRPSLYQKAGTKKLLLTTLAGSDNEEPEMKLTQIYFVFYRKYWMGLATSCGHKLRPGGAKSFQITI